METKLTTTELAVLGLLARGERSGYDLHRSAERSVGYIWTPAKSQIYKVLPRLVSHGLATRRDVVQTARPDKQLYRITRSGRAALREWVEIVEPATETNRDAVLLKIFFGELTRPSVVAEHVEALRRHDTKLVEEWEAIEPRLTASPADRHRYSTLRYGLARGRATLNWADEVLRELGLASRTRVASGR
ncbi:MAG: PadR family transcriptional regulator [Gaiellaceae bacterium]